MASASAQQSIVHLHRPFNALIVSSFFKEEGSSSLGRTTMRQLHTSGIHSQRFFLQHNPLHLPRLSAHLVQQAFKLHNRVTMRGCRMQASHQKACVVNAQSITYIALIDSCTCTSQWNGILHWTFPCQMCKSCPVFAWSASSMEEPSTGDWVQ